MITLSGLCVTLFFGGWHGPWATARPALVPAQGRSSLIFLFIWLRATLPRLRYDQLMRSAGRCCCRSRPSTPSSPPLLVVAVRMSPQPLEHAQGLRRHAAADLQEADHAAVPGVQAAGLPALPRPAPALDARERAREVRRLLALRGGVPGRLHPRRRRRRTPPRTASPPASATRASTRSTCSAASSAATASSRARSTRSRSATSSRSPSTRATT